jgi:hypothetical protein
MFAPSQEENTNPNETRFVSHSDGLASLADDWLIGYQNRTFLRQPLLTSR